MVDEDRSEPKREVAHGNCPTCGAAGVSKSGEVVTCENGHTYTETEALPPKKTF